MTLIEFLLARIAEAELSASDIHLVPDCATFTYYDEGGLPCDCGMPLRIGRECKAKRRIVAHAEQCDDAPIGGWCYSCHVALCALAAVYVDHRDYREEWLL